MHLSFRKKYVPPTPFLPHTNVPPQPLLQANYPFLRQKICLMALIESVFKRNADNRVLSFQTIAQETRLPHEEVEILVMKALRCVQWLANLCEGRLTDVIFHLQLEAHPRNN